MAALQVRRRWWRWLLIIAWILLLLWVKQWCGAAGATRMQWLLVPVSCLVTFGSGLDFSSLGSAGYYNAAQGFLIAPACSGLTFFILCTSTGSLPMLVSQEGGGYLLIRLVRTILLAYLLSVGANSVRILLALYCYQTEPFAGLIAADNLHRVIGIMVYVPVLHLCYPLLCGMRYPFTYWAGSSRECTNDWQVFWPLSCYLGCTLGIPLLHRVWIGYDSEFFTHGKIVLMSCLCFAFFVGSVVRARKKYDRL